VLVGPEKAVANRVKMSRGEAAVQKLDECFAHSNEIPASIPPSVRSQTRGELRQNVDQALTRTAQVKAD